MWKRQHWMPHVTYFNCDNRAKQCSMLNAHNINSIESEWKMCKFHFHGYIWLATIQINFIMHEKTFANASATHCCQLVLHVRPSIKAIARYRMQFKRNTYALPFYHLIWCSTSGGCQPHITSKKWFTISNVSLHLHQLNQWRNYCSDKTTTCMKMIDECLVVIDSQWVWRLQRKISRNHVRNGNFAWFCLARQLNT